MTDKIPYECPMCGRKGVASVVDDTPEHWVKILAKLLHCNRCADYREKHTRLEQRIRSAAFMVMASEHSKNRAELLEGIRDRLLTLTKAYAKVCCEYHRKPTMWEPDFVEMIMEKPDKAGFVMSKYKAGLTNGKLAA